MSKKGRPVTNDYSWMEDKYAKRWFVGLSARSQSNYKKQFGEVLAFLKMSPTEMIEKRVRDLTSQDLSERQFFEMKFMEFKGVLEETKPTHATVSAYLKCYASFFSRNGVKLSLIRGARANLEAHARSAFACFTAYHAADTVAFLFQRANCFISTVVFPVPGVPVKSSTRFCIASRPIDQKSNMQINFFS